MTNEVTPNLSLERAIASYLETYTRLYRTYCWTIGACCLSGTAAPGAALPLMLDRNPELMMTVVVILFLIAGLLLRVALCQRTVLRNLENWTRGDAA